MQYSPELIDRTKKYFTEAHGKELSSEEIIEALDAFAELVEVTGGAAGSALQGETSRPT